MPESVSTKKGSALCLKAEEEIALVQMIAMTGEKKINRELKEFLREKRSCLMNMIDNYFYKTSGKLMQTKRINRESICGLWFLNQQKIKFFDDVFPI
jgi:hypothetical protein